MAYDERLAARARKAFDGMKGVREISMMGGLCFTLRGHMCCGVLNHDLVVRVGPEAYEEALKESGARPMDFTGRPLRGFVFVGSAGHRADSKLRKWIRRAVEFVGTLPSKRGSRNVKRLRARNARVTRR
ncbi:MAG: TfoX/Sxy family protein [Planctomycetes bacterium]|nr:TfoX/Sxy family protein [Planctomycetota bacterium]